MGIGVYIAKFLAGGALVCIFALISEIFTPKRFAGLFSAAPSVLTAGLAVTMLTQGAAKASLQAAGAVAGAVGLIAYCLAATPAVRRFKSLGGSAVTTLLWLVVAAGAYVMLTMVVPS
jgi:Protein of unknown function (DUF3147)